MSELKATPGPWRVQAMKNGIEHEILHGEYYVATTFGGCPGEERAGSNADLIAAAPELYEALEQAKQELEEIALFDGGEPYNNLDINAALAKARGEQP